MRSRPSGTCWKNRISEIMAHKNNDISELIPDYCNNRLSAKERAEFETRLQDDPELLDECREFQGFQNLYRQVDPGEPAAADAIFARISREVSVHRAVGNKSPGLSGMLARSVGDFWQRFRQSIAVPWLLVAAQTAVLVFLLVPVQENTRYATLSTGNVAEHTEKTGINVVFRENAPEADIRALLHAIQGSISDGPSREGRYVISIGSQNDLDQAVRTLKQSKIVVFAEPLY